MSIDSLMEAIVSALPETSSRGRKTIPEVCLGLYEGKWSVLAGGHPAVHIGEWGGDFQGEGDTAEDALTACWESIKRSRGQGVGK